MGLDDLTAASLSARRKLARARNNGKGCRLTPQEARIIDGIINNGVSDEELKAGKWS